MTEIRCNLKCNNLLFTQSYKKEKQNMSSIVWLVGLFIHAAFLHVDTKPDYQLFVCWMR